MKKQYSNLTFKEREKETEKKFVTIDRKALNRRSKSFLGNVFSNDNSQNENNKTIAKSEDTKVLSISPNNTLNKSISFYQRIKQKMEENKIKTHQKARAIRDNESKNHTHLSYSAGDFVKIISHEKDELWNALNPKTKQKGLIDIRSFDEIQNKNHKKFDYYTNFEQVNNKKIPYLSTKKKYYLEI